MDASGRPMPDKDGNAITEFIRDSTGEPTEIQALDSVGKPVLTDSGWCRCVSKYDDNGNEIETAYFDTNGKSCLTTEGFSRATAKYDKHGNPIESGIFFGTSTVVKLKRPSSISAASPLSDLQFPRRGD
jgi:hypothetical protein